VLVVSPAIWRLRNTATTGNNLAPDVDRIALSRNLAGPAASLPCPTFLALILQIESNRVARDILFRLPVPSSLRIFLPLEQDHLLSALYLPAKRLKIRFYRCRNDM
jgi:hypothetical protein